MRVLEPHSVLVRITHWMNAASFVGLLVSGVAILLAHPRLYWGETGAMGAPSLVDLPLPLLLTGQSGWGDPCTSSRRGCASSWVAPMSRRGCARDTCVATWCPPRAICAGRPRTCGRSDPRAMRTWFTTPPSALVYVAVVGLLFPAMIWTGLAMSPAVTAVAPFLVTVLGGQQSARTIHFGVACALVLFLAGHVAMVALSGFRVRMRGMITGRRAMGAGRA